MTASGLYSSRPGKGFVHQMRSEFGMAFENALRGFGLPAQRAGEDRVEANIAPAEISAQQPRLR